MESMRSLERAEIQLELAEQIISQRMKLKKSLAFVRSKVHNDMRVVKKGSRTRKPSDNYAILRRFLDSLGEAAEGLLDMPQTAFVEMFRHRSPGEIEKVLALLEDREEQLEMLRQVLERVARPIKVARSVLVGRSAGSR